ncbi:Malonyl CoA-acyl carrier protein transacylase [Bathymodiolus heckerae thiotrophic gill symbiont]|uniref:ACP S-malonyltransferase n=1 Tax=Bathymodiolus heckerae thiotrophic gill symbiont TaxID=1052212 RepID=UPI0010B20492|nr:ACP S-malonyltransferase [Bathymodiolus heckerae thiotrophic gill symbiont]SMN13845.1 Malonyl CoA-acyl carrier protein transacylase [Bathymodiolus heckerae thiotrophic gill symbiont]SMN15855.1 Malonyl CoA-acyl carrier protein transacylase [uncultured Candidatus Thioglobus sp.]
MKYSLIFPGQGSQSLGMLSELAEHFPIVKETFSEASDVLGFDLWQLTQEDQDGLNQTQNTQPAMLAAGYATYQVLNGEMDLSPVCMAGHSLGEYTALVAAGALRFSDGVELVRQRAELMQSAVPAGVGAMAAILGLDDETVVKVCADYSGEGVVEAVNFNSLGQVVIAGNKEAVNSTCEAMKVAGAKRAVTLPVSVPSHCSLMNDAATVFANTVENVVFKTTEIDVLYNVDAAKASNVGELRAKLVAQLHKPVLWTGTVQAMADRGVEKLIESGPGKILTGLTRRIDKSLSANAVLDSVSVAATLKEIK